MIKASEENKEGEIEKMAKKFLTQNTTARLLAVKTIIDAKDKGQAIDFVTALEKALAPKAKTIAVAKSLQEILVVKKYLHDRAPSIKLLLEHLSLVI